MKSKSNYIGTVMIVMQEGTSVLSENVGTINVCAELTKLFTDHLGFNVTVNFTTDDTSTAGDISDIYLT